MYMEAKLIYIVFLQVTLSILVLYSCWLYDVICNGGRNFDKSREASCIDTNDIHDYVTGFPSVWCSVNQASSYIAKFVCFPDNREGRLPFKNCENITSVRIWIDITTQGISKTVQNINNIMWTVHIWIRYVRSTVRNRLSLLWTAASGWNQRKQHGSILLVLCGVIHWNWWIPLTKGL